MNNVILIHLNLTHQRGLLLITANVSYGRRLMSEILNLHCDECRIQDYQSGTVVNCFRDRYIIFARIVCNENAQVCYLFVRGG